MLQQTITAPALTTVTGSRCTVNINGTPTVVEVARGLTVAVDDVLLIHRAGAVWVASARLYAAAAAPPPPAPSPPAPKPSIVTGTLIVAPVETRSHRTVYGWRTDNRDIYHGQYAGWGIHTGCAFYGTKPLSLAGATVTGASIKVRRPESSGSTYDAAPTTIWLLSERTRPAGAPTRNESTAGPNIAAGRTAEFTIPTSWAQAIVDGSRGGIGFYEADGTPYVIFAGQTRWSAAMTLTLDWQRVT